MSESLVKAASQTVVNNSLLTFDGDSNAALANEIERWLNWQCSMLSGVKVGTSILHCNDLKLISQWPRESGDIDYITTLAHEAVNRREAVRRKLEVCEQESAQLVEYLALPILFNHQYVGAVVLVLSLRSEPQFEALKQLLQWGVAWLESCLVTSVDKDPVVYRNALKAVELLAENLPSAITGYHLCNYLAQLFDVDQVSLGFKCGLRVDLIAVSNHLQFDAKADVNRLIELAMVECTDQELPILYDANAATANVPYLCNAHVTLVQSITESIVYSVPLRNSEEVVGCITFHTTRPQALDAIVQLRVSETVNYLGTVLALKISSEQPWWQVAREFFKKQSRRLFSKGEPKFKALSLLAMSLLASLTLIEGDYTITARSQIEGSVQQLISAPFAGFIESVNVRPGDSVTKGQVLTALEDSELNLEKTQWQSKRDGIKREYYKALATGKRVDAGLMKERLLQAQARLNLIDSHIERAQLKAPFSGIVIKGDLSQSLGMPVEKGDRLFVISPLSEFSVVLYVDEVDIEEVGIGQQATLRLTGFPSTEITATITKITPIVSTYLQQSAFRVEAVAQDTKINIQPGMQGVARIITGTEPLFKVWGQSLFDRIRLWLWSIGL